MIARISHVGLLTLRREERPHAGIPVDLQEPQPAILSGSEQHDCFAPRITPVFEDDCAAIGRDLSSDMLQIVKGTIRWEVAHPYTLL
jgi:hypothetical protein